MRNLQKYTITSLFSIIAIIALYKAVTCVINYIALPIAILSYIVVAYTNKWYC